MSIERKHFGILSSGEDVHLYIMREGDFSCCWTDYGATWTSFKMPDRSGSMDDILLGFSDLGSYTRKHPFFGSTVGRFANRIGGASFTIGRKTYALEPNEGGVNHLHGGSRAFDKRLWSCEAASVPEGSRLVFSLRSWDGDEGYPGNVDVTVSVTLSSSGALRIEYGAVADAETPINLTNHAYFNLKGEGKGLIDSHVLRLACDSYLEIDSGKIPVPGAPRSVVGTPFDFRLPRRIGDALSEGMEGFDHCFIIDKSLAKDSESFAELLDPVSGRGVNICTSMPAVQFYTGNNLNSVLGKRGAIYAKRSGLCLETEYFPDSPNRADFPSCYAKPGAGWNSWTEYLFKAL